MKRTKLGSFGRIFVATALIVSGAGVLPASAQGTPEPVESSVTSGPSTNPQETPSTDVKDVSSNGSPAVSDSDSLSPVDVGGTPPADESGRSGQETPIPTTRLQDDANTQLDETVSTPPATKDKQRAAEPRVDKLPDSKLVVKKDNSLEGNPVRPGESFTYSLRASCESLTTDCVETTLSDILPAAFDVTALPKSTNDYDVSFDDKTRELKIVFKQKLQNPAGQTGLKAGSTYAVEIGMRLSPDTDAKDGITVPNELTVLQRTPRRLRTTQTW